MDCWHPITVRAEKPDAVQRWAQLEGKSPAMREELAQRYAPQKPNATSVDFRTLPFVRADRRRAQSVVAYLWQLERTCGGVMLSSSGRKHVFRV